MEFILRLQCDDVLGAKIERETPTGLVTIATAAPQGESLEVHLLNSQRTRVWNFSTDSGRGIAAI